MVITTDLPTWGEHLKGVSRMATHAVVQLERSLWWGIGRAEAGPPDNCSSAFAAVALIASKEQPVKLSGTPTGVQVWWKWQYGGQVALLVPVSSGAEQSQSGKSESFSPSHGLIQLYWCIMCIMWNEVPHISFFHVSTDYHTYGCKPSPVASSQAGLRIFIIFSFPVKMVTNSFMLSIQLFHWPIFLHKIAKKISL